MCYLRNFAIQSHLSCETHFHSWEAAGTWMRIFSWMKNIFSHILILVQSFRRNSSSCDRRVQLLSCFKSLKHFSAQNWTRSHWDSRVEPRSRFGVRVQEALDTFRGNFRCFPCERSGIWISAPFNSLGTMKNSRLSLHPSEPQLLCYYFDSMLGMHNWCTSVGQLDEAEQEIFIKPFQICFDFSSSVSDGVLKACKQSFSWLA